MVILVVTGSVTYRFSFLKELVSFACPIDFLEVLNKVQLHAVLIPWKNFGNADYGLRCRVPISSRVRSSPA